MDASALPRRQIGWSLYAIGVLLCLVPLGDLVAGVGSFNPDSAQWRFGAAGLLSSALVLPMLGVGLLFAAAALLEHRLMLQGLGVVCLLVLGVVLLTIVLFALDTLQVRVQFQDEAKRPFDLAAAKAAGTYLLEAIALTVLSVNLFRAAKVIPARRASRTTPLVVRSGES